MSHTNESFVDKPNASFAYTSLMSRTRELGIDVIEPTYDRSNVKCGIVQFGVGAFHRAHLAYFMDLLMHQHVTDWGIVGVSVRESDRHIHNALIAQNCYYTLLSRGSRPDDVEVRIIGSILDYVFAPDAPENVKARLMSANTKIVSLTVTEGGYDISNNPEIASDVQNIAQLIAPNSIIYPKSVFGWICCGLIWRREAGLSPYTVMSCDNLLHNGDTTKACLMRLISAIGSPELVQFFESKLSCPNSMVDRITPVTQPRDIAMMRQKYGIIDQFPILCESWTQWCIEKRENDFPIGMPPLHLLKEARYNLLVCDDVNPYENMKLRMLNATHSGICYLGHLADYNYVDQIMSDPLFQQFAERFMSREVRPSLPAVPNIDVEAYQSALIERFSNPNIKDTTLRICMDGASKYPKFLLDTLRAQLATIQRSGSQDPAPIHCIAMIIASWFRFLSGVNDDGQTIPINDPVAHQLGLVEAARTSRSDVKPLFALARSVFEEACDNPILVEHTQKALNLLYEVKAKEALKLWLEMK